MFIYSVKGSTLKFFGALSLSLLVLVLLVIFVPSYDEGSLPTGQEVEYSGIKTAEDRVNFLSQFGWTVEETPILEEDVIIPEDFDSVFAAYNDLQKTQGLDLARYKRKGVKHYRYKVTNHPSGTAVYANLLIYRGRVIGGDISSAAMNGFVYGFRGEDVKSPAED